MADAIAAPDIVALLVDRGLTIATGESITAGLVAGTLAEVPGCSTVLRGGVVAYQADVKTALLGVSASALDQGIVSRAVAVAMAQGAARALGADIGIGTTGVAGPEPHDGQPVGSVWIDAAGAGGVRSTHLSLTGDRAQIRCQTVEACWGLVSDLLAGS
ncbi:MAG: nicotinamide-nucleotide amidohydrolase family protein [Actinobacteria bacterium]|nr:nicotinamide-nucleotide amidohydrolase family protein [Actinomycetota bacterium]